jgi:dynein heavy chain
VLEDINCILNSGEVPNMYSNEELDAIADEVRLVLDNGAVPMSRRECLVRVCAR